MKKIDWPSFPQNLEFWCTECDASLVKSNDKLTGHFYYYDGHVWNGISFAKPVGDFHMFINAICADCEQIPERRLRIIFRNMRAGLLTLAEAKAQAATVFEEFSSLALQETPLAECKNTDCPVGCPESHAVDFNDA